MWNVRVVLAAVSIGWRIGGPDVQPAVCGLVVVGVVSRMNVGRHLDSVTRNVAQAVWIRNIFASPRNGIC